MGSGYHQLQRLKAASECKIWTFNSSTSVFPPKRMTFVKKNRKNCVWRLGLTEQIQNLIQSTTIISCNTCYGVKNHESTLRLSSLAAPTFRSRPHSLRHKQRRTSRWRRGGRWRRRSTLTRRGSRGWRRRRRSRSLSPPSSSSSPPSTSSLSEDGREEGDRARARRRLGEVSSSDYSDNNEERERWRGRLKPQVAQCSWIFNHLVCHDHH